MEDDQEARITIGRCRCGSQKTAGSGVIPPDVDIVVATSSNIYVSEALRLRHYNAFVVPVLTTWALGP